MTCPCKSARPTAPQKGAVFLGKIAAVQGGRLAAAARMDAGAWKTLQKRIKTRRSLDFPRKCSKIREKLPLRQE